MKSIAAQRYKAIGYTLENLINRKTVLQKTNISPYTILKISLGFLLGIVILITFYPFLGIGIVSCDDAMYYQLAFQKNIWSTAYEFAKGNGRFYFALINPLYTFPYLFDNFIFTKTIQYGSLFLCIFSFVALLKKATNSSYFSLLFLLFYLAFVSLYKWTSLIVCYPFCFTFSFSLLLWAAFSLLHYFDNKKKRFLYFSAGLYLAGLLFYEIYLFYLPIIALLYFSFYKPTASGRIAICKEYLIEAFPYILITLAYLVTYFVFYKTHPSNYIGNKVTPAFSFDTSIKLITNFTESAFPLSNFYQSQELLIDQNESIAGFKNDFSHLLIHANIEWIIKALIVCSLFSITIVSQPTLTHRQTLVLFLCAIILIYFSQLLLVLSEKYNSEPAINHKGYITTFYSFFGVLLLFATITSFVYSFAQKNKLTKYAFVLGCIAYIFTTSIKTSYANYYIAKDMKRIQMTMDVVEEFCNTKQFQNLEENSIVYAEDLFQNNSTQADIFALGFHWTPIVHLRKGKLIHFCKNKESFLETIQSHPTKPRFYITKKDALYSSESLLSFSALDSFQTTNNHLYPFVHATTLYYYSPTKKFGLSFDSNAKGREIKIRINGQESNVSENPITCNIQNLSKKEAFTEIQLESPLLDLSSLTISNLPYSNKPFFFIHQP